MVFAVTGEPRARGGPRPAKLHQLRATDPLTPLTPGAALGFPPSPHCDQLRTSEPSPQDSSIPQGALWRFHPTPGHPAHCTETDFIVKILKRKDAPRGCMQQGMGTGSVSQGPELGPQGCRDGRELCSGLFAPRLWACEYVAEIGAMCSSVQNSRQGVQGTHHWGARIQGCRLHLGLQA